MEAIIGIIKFAISGSVIPARNKADFISGSGARVATPLFPSTHIKLKLY